MYEDIVLICLVSFSFYPFFLPFFAHFLIFLQTPFLLPSFPYPPCVSVFLPLTHIISQSSFIVFSFLLFSALPPPIFFLNILYPSFPHFLLSISHFLSFFFLTPILCPYFPPFFSFCHPLFLYLFISFASFLPFNFLASLMVLCFPSDFLHPVYPLVLLARIMTLGVSTHNLSGGIGIFWGHGLCYLWRPQDGHVTITVHRIR